MKKRPEPPRKKPVKKVSPGYLERSALYYLERYASSSGNLRRRLLMKSKRSADAHGTDMDQAIAWIDALIEKLLLLGVLDDAKFAAMKVASLHRQGKAQRIIAQTLAVKGVGRGDIEKALSDFTVEQPDGDLAAAIAYARKRKFGPWRIKAVAPEKGQKELASLARRGFSLEVARTVLAAATPTAAEALLRQD